MVSMKCRKPPYPLHLFPPLSSLAAPEPCLFCKLASQPVVLMTSCCVQTMSVQASGPRCPYVLCDNQSSPRCRCSKSLLLRPTWMEEVSRPRRGVIVSKRHDSSFARLPQVIKMKQDPQRLLHTVRISAKRGQIDNI